MPIRRDEAEFQKWYATQVVPLGNDPNPDDYRHYYDWRAAYRAGAKPDRIGHWPSVHKREGHPNLIINGIDTRTGKRVMPRKRISARAGLSRRRKALGGSAAIMTERARIDAATTPGSAWAKKGPAPLTPGQVRSQGAAKRREGWLKGTGLGRLIDVLKGKKKD